MPTPSGRTQAVGLRTMIIGDQPRTHFADFMVVHNFVRGLEARSDLTPTNTSRARTPVRSADCFRERTARLLWSGQGHKMRSCHRMGRHEAERLCAKLVGRLVVNVAHGICQLAGRERKAAMVLPDMSSSHAPPLRHRQSVRS